MFEHEDSLSRLSASVPLREKLELIHSVVERRHSFVERISVAVYDPETDLLKTFVASFAGIRSPTAPSSEVGRLPVA